MLKLRPMPNQTVAADEAGGDNELHSNTIKIKMDKPVAGGICKVKGAASVASL